MRDQLDVFDIRHASPNPVPRAPPPCLAYGLNRRHDHGLDLDEILHVCPAGCHKPNGQTPIVDNLAQGIDLRWSTSSGAVHKRLPSCLPLHVFIFRLQHHGPPFCPPLVRSPNMRAVLQSAVEETERLVAPTQRYGNSVSHVTRAARSGVSERRCVRTRSEPVRWAELRNKGRITEDSLPFHSLFQLLSYIRQLRSISSRIPPVLLPRSYRLPSCLPEKSTSTRFLDPRSPTLSATNQLRNRKRTPPGRSMCTLPSSLKTPLAVDRRRTCTHLV